jgi:CheY-like chemotaxis protein
VSLQKLGIACAPQVAHWLADESGRGLRVTVLHSKVLLVEDSKFLRIANERALARAGFEVSTAADGEEALKVATAKLPDIILLDMLLPKLSGPEVLKALKKNPATMDIPVVVLTSLSQKNEEKLLQEGAAAYFEKSTLELDKSSDRLAATVETVLGRVNHQKDLNLRLKEAAQKRAAADDSAAEAWENEMSAVESKPCTTTIPQPPSKN